MATRTASARYDGLGPTGKGQVSTQSGVLRNQPYDFTTRFGETPGTNPEELAAAAHAACFTMSLSFALGQAGYKDGILRTEAAVTIGKDGDGFKISRSALTRDREDRWHRSGGIPEDRGGGGGRLPDLEAVQHRDHAGRQVGDLSQ
jgi:osmotically inducible protein OsmC